MSQYIVGNNQIGRLSLGKKLLSDTNSKEFLDNGNTFSPSGSSSAGRWLHPCTRDITRFNILEQGTIVGGHFYHMAVDLQFKTPHHVGYIALAVRQPNARKPAKVSVFRVEQFIRFCVV